MSIADLSEELIKDQHWNFYKTTFYPNEDDRSEPFSKRNVVQRPGADFTFSRFMIDVQGEVLGDISVISEDDVTEITMGHDDMWRLNYNKMKLYCKQKNIERKYYRKNSSYKLQKYILGQRRFHIHDSNAIETTKKYCKDNAVMEKIRKTFVAQVEMVDLRVDGFDNLSDRIAMLEEAGYYSDDYPEEKPGKRKRKDKKKV